MHFTGGWLSRLIGPKNSKSVRQLVSSDSPNTAPTGVEASGHLAAVDRLAGEDPG